jgi:hypothetical protein
LKETRPASRDAVVNAVQKRKLKGEPAPEMTKAEVQRRVDEFHDFAQQKSQQIQASAHRTAKEQAQGVAEGSAQGAHPDACGQRARSGSRKTIDQRFVKEFGSTYRVRVALRKGCDPQAEGGTRPKVICTDDVIKARSLRPSGRRR